MSAAVPAVSAAVAFPYSYVCILAIYWIIYCIPVAVGCAGDHPKVTVRLSRVRWPVIAVALALPCFVAIGAGTPGARFGDIELILLAIAVGAINGPLEEFAWRRTYRSNGSGSWRFEGLGLLMFTLWHIPLLLFSGVSYEFGALGLLGSAFFMGLVWLMMARATNSIGWPAVSHALVNIAAFIPFFQIGST